MPKRPKTKVKRMAKKKKKKYVIGIDLGGTKMLTGLLDRSFKILASEKSKVQVSEGEKHFLHSVTESIKTLLKEYEIEPKDLLGIGMGCPGIIDSERGVVLHSPNIPFLNQYPLGKKIEKIFKVPVVIGNDVNVGLFGEQRFGAAKGYDHVLGIFLGTGVGGGLIINGEIYGGSAGGAGEVGHMIVEPNGILCGCGQRGCLETIAGRLGIASEASMLAARQQAKKLYDLTEGDLTKIKSGVLSRAVKSGDKALKGLIEARAKKLGVAMASMVNLLNPEMIVLGGGLMEALADIILPAAEAQMQRHAMKNLVKDVRVVAAKLGDFAIVKGGAVMAAEYVLTRKD